MKQIQQEKYNRKAWQYQQLALPIAQNIEIAEDEPVFVANAQLEELDYRELYKAYSPIGRKSAAEPRIMFKLLVYGYMCGIYSTRKLEEACRKNIDFIWLLQGERVPDHCSIARFRSGKARDAIEGLFYQYVRKLAKEEEIQYEEVFIDGTKIESMANRYTFVWRKSVEKQLAKVKEKAKELFRQYGGNGNLTAGKLRRLAQSLVPEGGEMVRGTGRRKPSWQRQYEELEQLLERWDRYEAQLFEMGCRRNSLSKTDKDATFMRMKGGPYGQRTTEAPPYNVQLAVNSEYITGVAAFSHCTDSGTLIPFLEAYPADAGQKLPGHCSGCRLRKRGQLSVPGPQGPGMLYKACQLRSTKDQKVLAADLAAGEYAVSGTGRLFSLRRRKKADTAPKLLSKRKGHGHHHGLLPLRGVRRFVLCGSSAPPPGIRLSAKR